MGGRANSGSTCSVLPGQVLPTTSRYWFLKETRFLPGAFYVGQIPSQQLALKPAVKVWEPFGHLYWSLL